MKKTLDSLMIPAVLFTLLPMSAASFARCLSDGTGRTEIGHAIGVLMYENIVKDYASQVSIEDIAAGLKHASSAQGFELLPEETTLSAGVLSDRKMSVSAAQNIVDNWRAAPDSVGERFLSAYKKRSGTRQESNGLLWRKIDNERSVSADDNGLRTCMNDNAKSGNGKHVCFAQLEISEAAVCDASEEMNAYLEDSAATIGYGQFQTSEIIAGWRKAFEILEKQVKTSAGQGTDNSTATQSDFNYLEVVVPPELAYGAKGLPGKVNSNETLWFVMAVK